MCAVQDISPTIFLSPISVLLFPGVKITHRPLCEQRAHLLDFCYTRYAHVISLVNNTGPRYRHPYLGAYGISRLSSMTTTKNLAQITVPSFTCF